MTLFRSARRAAFLIAAFGLAVVAGCGRQQPPAADVPAVEVPRVALDTVQTGDPAVVGQTVYVPVYSHIYHQDGTREFDLTTTLSVRNTDPERAITIAAVGYHDSGGRLVRSYTPRPLHLGPLASEAFVVEDRDRTGGVGANFLVEWHAGGSVSAPLVEAVMISTAQSQGLSLISRGQAVRTLGQATPQDILLIHP